MIRIIVGMAATLLALSPMAAAAAPPLSAYGNLPAIENVAVSGSGTKLAFITVDGETRRLVAQQITGELISITALGDSKVRDVQWAGDDHLLVITSKTTSMPEYGLPEHEWFIAQSYSLRKKRFLSLSGAIPDSLNTIFSMPELRQVDGKWYAFIVTIHLIKPIMNLQRVALEDGAITTLEKMLLGQGEDWLVDAGGVPRARARYDQARGFWSLGVRRGTIWPDIYQVDAALDSPAMVGFSRDGRSVVVAQDTELGQQFIEVDPDTGQTRPATPDDRRYRDIVIDPATQRMIGAAYFDGHVRYVFFDPADQVAWDKVGRAFKDQWVTLTTWSADRQKVVVKVEGPQNSGVYYLVDLAAKRADILGEAYPGVPAAEVAPVQPYSYQAADGRRIPGYLTLPPGRAAKDLPLVVLPHGGPQAYDAQGFDWWAQAIASRGYAVLQPNFRGSAGYGEEHLTAGYGQWGRKMQTDLSDGVKALAAEGLIDPARVCIVGASYGGYAAMAGVSLQQGVYRCAVSIAGVSDLRDMLRWRAERGGRNTESQRYWRRFMGAQSDVDPALDAISPLRQAAQVEAPILLIHGEDDTVVPYRQSARFAEALRKAGKPVEVVTLDEEDHWLSRGRTRQQMLEATVGFLLRHNPPD